MNGTVRECMERASLIWMVIAEICLYMDMSKM